jgi:hypothetical protein
MVALGSSGIVLMRGMGGVKWGEKRVRELLLLK